MGCIICLPCFIANSPCWQILKSKAHKTNIATGETIKVFFLLFYVYKTCCDKFQGFIICVSWMFLATRFQVSVQFSVQMIDQIYYQYLLSLKHLHLDLIINLLTVLIILMIDVCSLFFYCKKRLEYFDLLNHRTSIILIIVTIWRWSWNWNLPCLCAAWTLWSSSSSSSNISQGIAAHHALLLNWHFSNGQKTHIFLPWDMLGTPIVAHV